MASHDNADLDLPDPTTVTKGSRGARLSNDFPPAESSETLGAKLIHTPSSHACVPAESMNSESQLEKKPNAKDENRDSAESRNQDFGSSVSEVLTAQATMPAVPSDSAVTQSKEAENTDKALPSSCYTYGTKSSLSKAADVSGQVISSSPNSAKDATQQKSPHMASVSSDVRQNTNQSEPSSTQPKRPQAKLFKTSEATTVNSRAPTMRSNAPTGRSQPEQREWADVDTARLLDVLLANLKESPGDSHRGQRGLPNQGGGATRLPFSVSTRRAQPLARLMVDRGVFARGLPTSKPAAGEKGYSLFQFAARAGSASVFLLFVIYMLQGLRSNVLSCSDYNCSSSSPVYPPPNI